MTRLRLNPDPLKVVSGGLREAFKPYVPPRRCEHEDGRGQCTSLDTMLYLDADRCGVYCARHAPT